MKILLRGMGLWSRVMYIYNWSYFLPSSRPQPINDLEVRQSIRYFKWQSPLKHTYVQKITPSSGEVCEYFDEQELLISPQKLYGRYGAWKGFSAVDGDRSIERFNYTVRRWGGKCPSETVQNYCPKALAVEVTLGTSKASRVETIVQGRRFRREKLIGWSFAVVENLCKV